MKENKFLKVMGIIMLVCGVIGAVVSLIPIAWDAILALIGVKLSQMLTRVLGTALLVISVVLQIIAGVKGINASTRPEKAPACVKLGIAIIVLAVLSNILGALAPDGKFDIASLILNAIIPGLYVYSAMQKPTESN